MPKISGVIITFNEESNIARCLESLNGVVDEIVVVDSYSTDKTEEICRSFGVRFIQNPFQGHIQQKNFAMQQAENPWVLSLDADEALSKELQTSILDWKKDPDINTRGYWVNRLNNYCGTWLKHGGWYPDRKIRLWDRREGDWKGINPHDFVTMNAGIQTGRLKGDLLHYTYRTVQEHIQQCENFSEIGSKALFEKGVKSNTVLITVKPVIKFVGMYFFKLGILDGKYGLTVAKYSAYEKYLKYKKLKERWETSV